MALTADVDFARGRERSGGDPKLLYVRLRLRGSEWSGIGHSWISVAPVERRPGEHLRGEGRLLPRCSCPYAGTTRIRFEGFPRPCSGRRPLSPLSGHPLDAVIIRRVCPGRQGSSEGG